MSEKKAEKHGILGGTIKVIMVIVFFIIGAAILTLGILGVTQWSKYVPAWIAGCNIGFGACLLTSPFFLSNKRKGLIKIIKVLMTIVFVLIGIFFIVCGSLELSIFKEQYKTIMWYPIITLVFGCLLFTSPFFLKKSL